MVFKGGRVVGQVASALPKAKLEELLKKALEGSLTGRPPRRRARRCGP
jgi:hypothetical protein